MSLIKDFETEVAHVAKDVLDADKAAAAYIYGAVKKAGMAGEQAVLAQIPGLAKKVREYATDAVQSIEQDPAFEHAVGDWKFGAAASRVMSLVAAEYPVAAKLGGKTLQTVIETGVQAAVMGLLTGLL